MNLFNAKIRRVVLVFSTGKALNAKTRGILVRIFF